MENKRFGIFSSSEDPYKLGDTVKGIILALSVGIIFILDQFGIKIGSAEISAFAIGAGTAVSSAVILFGILKKAFIWTHDMIKPEAK